jgi:hypothetical protein
MTTFKPEVSLGPLTFTSGYAPKAIDGPKRDMHLLEHEIPGREGGIVEYLGSNQPTYRLQGFFAPLNDVFNGPSASVLSGAAYVPVTPDAAAAYLMGLRGSGVLLLQVESTWSQYSGYSVWYDQDFYYIKSVNVAMEAGKGYPYYPYTIDLLRASTLTYGNSSGTNVWTGTSGGYLSGFVFAWYQSSGWAKGETINTMGVYVAAVSSGSLRVAIYDHVGPTLQAQSAVAPAASGWNYFPLQPSFTTTSGTGYYLAVMGDQPSALTLELLVASGAASIPVFISGTPFLSGFPSSLTGSVTNPGVCLDIVMVAP